MNWRESFGELSRQMSERTEELVEATSKRTEELVEATSKAVITSLEALQQPQQTAGGDGGGGGSGGGLGLPPTSAAPKPGSGSGSAAGGSSSSKQMPEVMVEFRADGPIGINFESRGRDTRGPMTIVSCVPGGAASKEPDIVPNSIVLAVNGASVVGLPFQQALAMIKESPRPLVLAIRPPAPFEALGSA